MRKFFSVLFSTFLYVFCVAQFTANDVKFFAGTGSQTAYFVTDFKDGTDDRSYVWGVRFNPGQNITPPQMLQMIKAAEPAFDYNLTFNNGFLDKVSFNSHSQQSSPDWWSLWTATDPSAFGMNGWMNSGIIEDGTWYGASYGFSNPTAESPVLPIAAYGSQWYNASQITNWIGVGSHKSLVVVDFGTNNSNGNANSFVFGIQYNGTITGEQALQMIASYTNTFSFTAASNQISSASLNSFSGTSSGNSSWKLYKGTNLSNWKTSANLSSVVLNNNDWFGLSFGSRRPFIPTEANVNLSVKDIAKESFRIYPNPASDFIMIDTTNKIEKVALYSVTGQQVLTAVNNKINIQNLPSGVYVVEIQTDKSVISKKIIKR